MYGVILDNHWFFDSFKTLEDAKKYAFQLSQLKPSFKSIKVVEVKE